MINPAAPVRVAVEAPRRTTNRTTPRQAWCYVILAAATMLTACAPTAAETTRPPAESRSDSGADEWLRRIVLNDPPAPPPINPLDVMAATHVTH